MRSSEPQLEEERRVAPFIDGAPVDSVSDATVDVVDPSTGRRRLSIPRGGEADVDRAVASARRVFDAGTWSESPPSFRKKTLHRFADLIAAHAARLDELDAGEMGKPVSLSFASAASAAALMRFYAESVDKVMGDVLTSDKMSFVTQRRVPRGVIAAVTPWNFPTSNAIRKLGPALSAGNGVVLKPSELSSRSALQLAALAMEAGLPPGVLNVVPGVGETVGRALGLHKDVDMLAFTGSTQVGKAMLSYASQSNLKVVQAECGGKSPQIVFDDGVDLDAAAASIAGFLLTNQGQICSVGSRVLVQRSIEQALVEKIVARLGSVVMGNALDPKTTFGPVASESQWTRILNYVESAQNDGARLVAGGRKALAQSGGYFIEPTVFTGAAPTARIAQEEIFGPVLAVMAFESEAEALRIANGTLYGLAAYVWSASTSTALRVAKTIRANVWIYAAAPAGEGAGHALSFEPAGQSGIGTEGGLAGMESYLRRQVISIVHG